MKVALITDLHFGARSDNILFDSFFAEFYKNCFFPLLKANPDIEAVFILGDVFDRRKYVNYNLLRSCKEYFFTPLSKTKLPVTILVGNHDCYFKNTNDVNSLELLLSEYKNITILKDPKEICLDGLNILLVPWIFNEKFPESLKIIDRSVSPVCFGHFEIAGFEMHMGQTNDHGLDRKMFDKFDLVLTGHFHHKSSDGLITYLGNPYEITWSDYNDPRGFHVFDTKTLDLKFIENPFKMFHKIYYDDLGAQEEYDFNTFTGKYIKCIVVNKKDYFKFDQFIEKLYQSNPAELKIIEDLDEFNEMQDLAEGADVEDTISLLGHYVDSIETDMNKEKLKSTLKSLYIEASATEKN